MKFECLLEKIVQSNSLHAKWLNTLSYLENCGARKIAACEHPILVKEEMLKHAAEEFRHAHYLKNQIKKISDHPFSTYSLSNILGGISSLHYLNALDLFASRFLSKTLAFSKRDVKKIAYHCVTYAIELRAEQLYPRYHKILRKAKSCVFVKSIILEEKEHLKEMRDSLGQISSGLTYAKTVCEFEKNLYVKWLKAVELEMISSH